MRGFVGFCRICYVRSVSTQRLRGSPYWKHSITIREVEEQGTEDGPPVTPRESSDVVAPLRVEPAKNSTAKPTCFAVWIASARRSGVAIFSSLRVSAMPMPGSGFSAVRLGTQHVPPFVALWDTRYRPRKQSPRSAANSIRPIEQWLRICRPIQALAWNRWMVKMSWS